MIFRAWQAGRRGTASSTIVKDWQTLNRKGERDRKELKEGVLNISSYGTGLLTPRCWDFSFPN